MEELGQDPHYLTMDTWTPCSFGPDIKAGEEEPRLGFPILEPHLCAEVLTAVEQHVVTSCVYDKVELANAWVWLFTDSPGQCSEKVCASQETPNLRPGEYSIP